MRKLSLKIFTLLALWATASLVLAESNDSVTLNQIAGYRQWTRVSKKPVEVREVRVLNEATPSLALAGG